MLWFGIEFFPILSTIFSSIVYYMYWLVYKHKIPLYELIYISFFQYSTYSSYLYSKANIYSRSTYRHMVATRRIHSMMEERYLEFLG